MAAKVVKECYTLLFYIHIKKNIFSRFKVFAHIVIIWIQWTTVLQSPGNKGVVMYCAGMDRATQHQSLLQQHRGTHSRSNSDGNRMLKLDPSDTDPLTKSEGGKAAVQTIPPQLYWMSSIPWRIYDLLTDITGDEAALILWLHLILAEIFHFNPYYL